MTAACVKGAIFRSLSKTLPPHDSFSLSTRRMSRRETFRSCPSTPPPLHPHRVTRFTFRLFLRTIYTSKSVPRIRRPGRDRDATGPRSDSKISHDTTLVRAHANPGLLRLFPVTTPEREEDDLESRARGWARRVMVVGCRFRSRTPFPRERDSPRSSDPRRSVEKAHASRIAGTRGSR